MKITAPAISPASQELTAMALDNAPEILPFPRKVKVGFVGLNFGRDVIREIMASPANDFIEIAAVCDSSPVRLIEGSSTLSPAVPRYESMDELLEDPDIEAVGLFTGPVGRADLLRRIFRAGRHAITTKPLEQDPAAARIVLQEARDLGLIVQCNSPSVFPVNDLEVIKSWEKKYDLGRPAAARANTWTSYREDADGSWYDDADKCPAAPLYRLGIYLINDLVNLWGSVERVQVLQTRIFTGRPTADNAQVGLQFENGALASVYSSFCVGDGDHYGNSMVLNYENGTIYRNAGPAWPSPRNGRSRLVLVQKNEGKTPTRDSAIVIGQSGAYQWENFARAVRGAKIPQDLTPDQMVEGLRVMRAIAQAQRNGGVSQVVR